MRSAAHFKGHPIHPALIPFPFAFLWGAFAFDAGARLLANHSFAVTGKHLAIAGVLTALVAAVPGFVDYLRVVPPESSGRARATKHMSLNLTAVGTFAVALLLRGDDPTSPGIVALLLEGTGVTLLTVGAWMGGTLVSRNQISVDHRYAEAGKWKETSVAVKDGKPAVVARSDELKVDQMKLLRVDGERIVLARTERGYAAFADRCTHKGGSLADGVLICGTVQCPWHGSQFDVHTGELKAGPAAEGIRAYQVREVEGEVRLTL